MIARSRRHRSSRRVGVLLRRVGSPSRINVQLTLLPGSEGVISQSFLIMDGKPHRADLTGYRRDAYGTFHLITVPAAVTARVA